MIESSDPSPRVYKSFLVFCLISGLFVLWTLIVFYNELRWGREAYFHYFFILAPAGALILGLALNYKVIYNNYIFVAIVSSVYLITSNYYRFTIKSTTDIKLFYTWELFLYVFGYLYVIKLRNRKMELKSLEVSCFSVVRRFLVLAIILVPLMTVLVLWIVIQTN
ncbi:MAG: hypothetical protein IH840_11415 [Candidatus Heimdallarchaeota archaeon]|nr:hypothetical protein [Candidatus Heimdallarchaeota archaeon]